ncbi:hypothetical protein GH789_03880 [Rhizobium pusense]|nr:hypothetical protein [Agrobacterium pusense]
MIGRVCRSARFRTTGIFPPSALSEVIFVRQNKKASRCLYVVQEAIPNLFLPHYLRKKR